MIGISIGAMNTSVALSDSASQNSTRFLCDIILSETSARTIPSVIGYSKSHRMIGEHAMITIRKHMNSTFMHLNRLIGMKVSSEFCKRELEYHLTDIEFQVNESEELMYKVPLKLNEGVSNVSSNNLNNLLSESLLAAFINKIKNDLIISTHKKECFAFTIAVPDFFTLNQREAVARSMKICDIDNFNIINESSAITLYYGYNKYKTLFAEEKLTKSSTSTTVINPTTTRHVIFIDFGHSKTSLIFSEFKPTVFRVLNCVVDPFLGGREMDRLIFIHMCKIFYDKYKIDITGIKKSAIRLMEQVTKARKILTANQETVINIDCLFEDYDFSYMLARKEFESLIQPVIDNFTSMFSSFYKTCFSSIDRQIYSIEMAGECMRTPIFQNIVKEITNKEIQKAIIIDEAVSKGACMYTALMYNTLPLVSFNGVYHYNPYTILYEVNESSTWNIFINRGEPVPSTKSFEFSLNSLTNTSGILKILFSYLKQDTEFLLDSNSIITEYNINIDELFRVNKLTSFNTSGISCLTFEFLIDNYSKLHLQSIKSNISKTNLNLNIDILCFNKNVFSHTNTLIKPYAAENVIISECKKIEQAHYQQDEYVKSLHLKKNQIESNVYKLKNKYLEKENEYEKLNANYSGDNIGGSNQIDQSNITHISNDSMTSNNSNTHLNINSNQHRTLLSRLNSVEEHIAGQGDSFDYSHLEKADAKLREVEKIMNLNSNIKKPQSVTTQQSTQSKKKSSKDEGYYKINDRLNHYTNLLDLEYIKLLDGKKTKFDEKTINLISEILSKYRLLIENANEYRDYELYLSNLEKEMKKYFK